MLQQPRPPAWMDEEFTSVTPGGLVREAWSFGGGNRRVGWLLIFVCVTRWRRRSYSYSLSAFRIRASAT
ncbi:MAG: hypothetical protein ACKO85_09030, partial [Isosphaeraceae bacterium]